MDINGEIKDLRESTQNLLIISITGIITLFLGTLIPLLVMFYNLNSNINSII